MDSPLLQTTPRTWTTPGFFSRYNRTMAWACTLLVCGLAAFFVLDLNQELDAEVQLIEGQVERHSQFFEFVLRSATDQVENLRMSLAASDLTSTCAQGRQAVKQGRVQSSGQGFHRDALTTPDLGGNLVGTGSLRDRNEMFYCELGAALALDSHLQAMAFHAPQVARARFISTQGFHVESPWRASGELALEPAVQAAQDERMAWVGRPDPAGSPPDQRPVWSGVYSGGDELGLLAPILAPAYRGRQFRGLVSVDISLDYLRRVNRGFTYPLGRTLLVDQQGQVLADSASLADPLSLKPLPLMAQAGLPAALASKQVLASLSPARSQEFDGVLAIGSRFNSAPWQLIYLVPRQALWMQLLRSRTPGTLAIFLSLASLLVVTYRVTSREFIRPASQLVSHVAAASIFQPQPVPKVPPAWRPWFDAITQAFDASVQLAGLRQELQIAAHMQQTLLPRPWPHDARFELRGTMVPAKDIGGDFFDHFLLPADRVGLVVADVSGKGIPAGLFGMLSKTLLRSHATQRPQSPADVISQANDALCQDNEASMFVTTFYGQYNPATGELVYVNAGHPPPLILRADGQLHWLPSSGGMALGVVPDLSYQQACVQLSPGDTLLVFTDGVTEAIDPLTREFGVARLASLLKKQTQIQPHYIIEQVLQAVRDFGAGVEPHDDITCLALRCLQPGPRV